LSIELQNAFEDNYIYEFAECPDEALEIIEEFHENEIRILLIVSDWLMPGMKGDEFLIRVHEKYPNIVKIMLTGQADEEAVSRAKKDANLYQCLRKPWNSHELIGTIRSALAQLCKLPLQLSASMTT
jgi:CheY-like chemotaxis protein